MNWPKRITYTNSLNNIAYKKNKKNKTKNKKQMKTSHINKITKQAMLKYYKKEFPKTNILQINQNNYNKYKPTKRCSWETDAKSLKIQYKSTIEQRKTQIYVKNTMNKILTSIPILNVVVDGGALSHVRGAGYLRMSRVYYGDDQDIYFFIEIPEEIVKKRTIKIMPNLFKSCKEDNSDSNYIRKLRTSILLYYMLQNDKIDFNDDYGNWNFKKPSHDVSLYLTINGRANWIKGAILSKNDFCYSDLISLSFSDFLNNKRRFGELRLVNIEGQDAICYEGNHKFIQNAYGPTYMTPLMTGSGCAGIKPPFIDEWRKKWLELDFKPQQASRQFWEKENKIFLDKDWKAPAFNEGSYDWKNNVYNY
jgi:hypothetical protein